MPLVSSFQPLSFSSRLSRRFDESVGRVDASGRKQLIEAAIKVITDAMERGTIGSEEGRRILEGLMVAKVTSHFELAFQAYDPLGNPPRGR